MQTGDGLYKELDKQKSQEIQTTEEKEQQKVLRKPVDYDPLAPEVQTEEVTSVQSRPKVFKEKPSVVVEPGAILSVVREEDREVQEEKEEDLDFSHLEQQAHIHDLSSKGFAMRNYVVRQMRLDKTTSRQIEESKKDLRYVVETFAQRRDKDKLAESAVTCLKDFHKLQQSLAADPVLGTQEKARTLFNLTKSYAVTIATYKELYVDKLNQSKRKRDINTLIDRYYGLIEYFELKDSGKRPDPQILNEMGLTDMSAHQRVFGKDTDVLSKAKKQAHFLDTVEGESAYQERSEEEAHKEAEELDNGISYQQALEVRKVDAWIARQAADHKEKIPFVNRILSLSIRERLFIYQSIEKKDYLANPKLTFAATSQFGYVPDFEAITRSLSRSGRRFWEVLKPDGLMRFHWDKLEAALTQVQNPEIAAAIRQYAAFETDYEVDITKEQILEKQEEKKPRTKEEKQLEEDAKKICRLEADRNIALQ